MIFLFFYFHDKSPKRHEGSFAITKTTPSTTLKRTSNKHRNEYIEKTANTISRPRAERWEQSNTEIYNRTKHTRKEIPRICIVKNRSTDRNNRVRSNSKIRKSRQLAALSIREGMQHRSARAEFIEQYIYRVYNFVRGSVTYAWHKANDMTHD